MAAWDLFARQQGQPLASVLGGSRARRLTSGVSIGIQDSLDELASASRIELAAGYRRIKIKIKPGWDVERGRAGPRTRFGDIPADGGRQRRLHADRRRPPGGARSRSI